jgi:dTDP-4-amino-4,6-dideoxygalactose transaminase
MIISERIKQVFERKQWILGEHVTELETRIANYFGA